MLVAALIISDIVIRIAWSELMVGDVTTCTRTLSFVVFHIQKSPNRYGDFAAKSHSIYGAFCRSLCRVVGSW